MITSDYTTEAKSDSMKPGYMQGYRVVHWFRDILRNFFSSPVNIRDERVCGLLRMKDGMTDEQMNALFRVDLPYSEHGFVKAGATPCILVSLAGTEYPVQQSNIAGGTVTGGGMARYKGMKYRTMKMQVAVVTETYDGTLLLAGLLEDFLVTHEYELVQDCGMISRMTVVNSTGPQVLQAGSDANARQLYQSVISTSVTGGISWVSDTQGPVFRGVRVSNS